MDASIRLHVDESIGERAAHLHQFISGYSTFSRLPAPCPTKVCWQDFLQDIARHHRCHIVGSVPEEPGWFDRPQLEQALINVLRNAEEAGGADRAFCHTNRGRAAHRSA